VSCFAKFADQISELLEQSRLLLVLVNVGGLEPLDQLVHSFLAYTDLVVFDPCSLRRLYVLSIALL